MKLFRPLLAVLAVAAVFALVIADADARPRVSAGSRGSKTFSAPPPTATAPNATAPINRTMTTPGTPGMATTAARPPVAQPGGMFGGARGMLGGLAAGLLGAGLIGMLMGNGFLGGLAGLASVFGLLLQVALIAGIGFLLFRWWQRRSQPQAAYAGMPRDMAQEPQQRSALGGFGGGAAPAVEPLEIKGEDFDTFERMLGEIQTAYGREDLTALLVGGWLLGIGCALAGIVAGAIAAKSPGVWSLLAFFSMVVVLNVYSFLWSIGAVVSAFS